MQCKIIMLNITFYLICFMRASNVSFIFIIIIVFCYAFIIVLFHHCLIVTSDSASQISISSDQRSLGDTSDITTLQEECIAFGKYKYFLY